MIPGAVPELRQIISQTLECERVHTVVWWRARAEDSTFRFYRDPMGAFDLPPGPWESGRGSGRESGGMLKNGSRFCRFNALESKPNDADVNRKGATLICSLHLTEHRTLCHGKCREPEHRPSSSTYPDISLYVITYPSQFDT